MADVFERLAGLNKVVHEPARLSIMTALLGCRRADFVFLQRLIGLTRGNLSSHLMKLEEVGFVAIEKAFIGKKPHTFVSLTVTGREAIETHWRQLEDAYNSARDWRLRKARTISLGAHQWMEARNEMKG